MRLNPPEALEKNYPKGQEGQGIIGSKGDPKNSQCDDEVCQRSSTTLSALKAGLTPKGCTPVFQRHPCQGSRVLGILSSAHPGCQQHADALFALKALHSDREEHQTLGSGWFNPGRLAGLSYAHTEPLIGFELSCSDDT
ncbi:hypothetical protein QQF64_011550 [Cirrhinus molitorella]|uniref:Uncharacterized protein n=1 Tax=Cirrhinus molitorella TaxID=172907 RepID=A0ABR3LZK7_9TELE